MERSGYAVLNVGKKHFLLKTKQRLRISLIFVKKNDAD
jgi:hypothetical protein